MMTILRHLKTNLRLWKPITFIKDNYYDNAAAADDDDDDDRDPGPLKCFCASHHQISAKSVPQKARNSDKAKFATKLRQLSMHCVNEQWTMRNNKALKLAFHVYFLQGIVICLTCDNSAYHHQSNMPPQPVVCPHHDGRDAKKSGPDRDSDDVADFPAVFFHIFHWYLSWNKSKSQESVE